MPRAKNRQWIRRHINDPYVKLSQKEGYRSRAVYKLSEIHDRDKLFHAGMTVIDLGAAPGGWSQLAMELVGDRGQIFALDILPMDSIAGVTFVQGDFTEAETYQALQELLQKKQVDLIISDMSPNLSGQKAVDQPRSIYLAELALDFAEQHLKPGGDLLIKIFQGEGFDELNQQLRRLFAKVLIRKPKASRDCSREVYCLAKNLLGNKSS
ncbi:MAG: rlmE [Gammaproteobacteria bacterium]|jgi:23S rRNA (uridine2552-2'-O)-methyltransferase|nr:rlmE [Gammaproteobacteria bacterium]